MPTRFLAARTLHSTKNPIDASIQKAEHLAMCRLFTLNTLLWIIKNKIHYFGVAFDTAAKTVFRDEIYKEYKSQPTRNPEDIRYGILS